VESVLRGGAIANLALDDPAAVIGALNNAFPMEQNDGRFFTMWYGVYDRHDRSLLYTNAGHPPPLVFHGSEVARLEATDMIVGLMPDWQFRAKRVPVSEGTRLYLYSDGAYEVTTPQGTMMQIDDLQTIIAGVSKTDGPQTAEILRLIREAHGKIELQDDLSLLEVTFGEG
jgi:sigma-B regulation protein RsbU (phosphoserine phosphatase)